MHFATSAVAWLAGEKEGQRLEAHMQDKTSILKTETLKRHREENRGGQNSGNLASTESAPINRDSALSDAICDGESEALSASLKRPTSSGIEVRAPPIES